MRTFASSIPSVLRKDLHEHIYLCFNIKKIKLLFRNTHYSIAFVYCLKKTEETEESTPTKQYRATAITVSWLDGELQGSVLSDGIGAEM